MGDKILVVDDEPDMEALISQRYRKQIREGTLQFEFAHNGRTALEKLQQEEDIMLVMTDINMPEMDGLTLLGKIKDMNRPIRTLVVSAYGDLKNIREAMNKGSFDFLVKPLDFQDFDVTLNKTLENLHFTIASIETQHQLESERQKRIEAQEEALVSAEKNATLIREQNAVLEEKVKERTQQLIESYHKLQEQNNIITKEKERSDELLLNILPEETADELKRNGSVQAKQYDNVSVLFTDFKDFSKLAEKLSPQELVNVIDYYYKAFDKIVETHGLEKIKTIGDAYMAAGGLPIPTDDNALVVLRTALAIRDFVNIEKLKRQQSKEPFFEIRIGINTGPLVAGVVGFRKFVYDIWGDTVNLASRMESSSEAGRVNISEHTHCLVKDNFECTYRGKIEVKNKGEVEMYFVEREIKQPILV
jgi:class 3 adenylate cyclase/DNA-binding NarL/FixJ family response regulator